MKIENAIIENVSLSNADHGCLTGWVFVKYDSYGSQGFGGYRLFRGENDFVEPNYAVLFIDGILTALQVTSWEKLPGTAIRVKIEDGIIRAIGHIIEDSWYNHSEVTVRHQKAFEAM